MKYVFLQDLFSNFLLAMLVLAVIAMRTQSDVPPQPSPRSACPPLLKSAAEIDQKQDLLIAVSTIQDYGRQFERIQEKQVFFNRRNNPQGQSWRVSFVSNGCILSSLTCPGTLNETLNGVSEMFNKCAADG